MPSSKPGGRTAPLDQAARQGDAASTLGPPAGHSTLGVQGRAAPAGGSTALPESFGRYRIVKLLGRGGMGAVYLAHDSQLDRHVALKVPHFAPNDGSDVLERFQREARAAATIEHPNICPIYDVGTIEGLPYATMAYIEGKPLSELLKTDKRLPQRPVAAVVRKLALAMQAAHAKGVVHRDLKPANVMINQRSEPVIMDFGLARRSEQDTRLTVSGAILGTPAYMSPEQARGEQSGKLGDIYSLGVILYEMLAGRLPFQGGVSAMLSQIQNVHPAPPESHNPGVEPALSIICLKAMAKQPRDRFASMKELADTLAAYLKTGANPAAPRPQGLATTIPAEPASSRPTAAPESARDGEGLATQLLARLAERLEAPPPTPPPPKHAWGQWLLAISAAVLLIAATMTGAFLLNQRAQPIDVHTTVAVNVQAVLPEALAPTVVLLVLDGRSISREELAQPISLTPGDHDLEIVNRDGTRQTRSFTVNHDSGVELTGGSRATVQSSPARTNKKPAIAAPADIAWDLTSIERLFRIDEIEQFDPNEGKISWILISKEKIDRPAIRATMFDAKNVQISDTSLSLTPYEIERAGVRVRAVLQATPLRTISTQKPERVVLELTARGLAKNAAQIVEGATWDIAALEARYKILKRTIESDPNQVIWLMESKGKTNFTYSSPFRARYIDDEGVLIDEVDISLQPYKAEPGEKVRATVSLPYLGTGRQTKTLHKVTIEERK